MKHYFGDASYWIGRIDPDDELHQKAADYTAVIELENGRIFTTQLALNEVLNPRSGTSRRQRQAAVDLVNRIGRNPNIANDAHRWALEHITRILGAQVV